jgi:hypothetical protein
MEFRPGAMLVFGRHVNHASDSCVEQPAPKQ